MRCSWNSRQVSSFLVLQVWPSGGWLAMPLHLAAIYMQLTHHLPPWYMICPHLYISSFLSIQYIYKDWSYISPLEAQFKIKKYIRVYCIPQHWYLMTICFLGLGWYISWRWIIVYNVFTSVNISWRYVSLDWSDISLGGG